MEDILIKRAPSFNVQIWCGLTEGYNGQHHYSGEVFNICQKYVDQKGACVSITPTVFTYKDGCEDGVVIGFISYPRFERSQEEIVERAIELGKILLKKLGQNRLTITTPVESIMLESNKNGKDEREKSENV